MHFDCLSKVEMAFRRAREAIVRRCQRTNNRNLGASDGVDLVAQIILCAKV